MKAPITSAQAMSHPTVVATINVLSELCKKLSAELETARADEREACADIADRLPRTYRETKKAHERATLEPFHPSRFSFDFAEMRQAEVITHAIRARGTT